MSAGVLILPFLSLFFAAIGIVVHSSFKEIIWLAPLIWLIAASLAGIWIYLDRAHLKRLFIRKGAKYGASTGLTVILGLLVAAGIGMLSTRARFNKTIDFTKDHANTLAEQSLKVIENLNKQGIETEIIGFFQDDQQEQKFRNLVQLYESSGAKFRQSYVNPQAEPTKSMAEGVTQGNTVVVRQGTNQAKITTFTEEKFTNALIQSAKSRTKKVFFLKGHGEGDITSEDAEGFKAAVDELTSNKLQVSTLELLETGKIPDDADLVILAGPKYDLKEEEIKLLDTYLQSGKPFLALVDAMAPVSTVNKMLEKYGLSFGSDLLIMRPDDPRAQLIGQNNAIVTEFDAFHAVTKDFAHQSSVSILMANTRSVDILTDNSMHLKPSSIGKSADVIIGVSNVKSMADLKEIGADRIKTGPFGVIAVSSGKVGGVVAANEKADNKEQTADLKPVKADVMAKDIRIAAVGSSQFVTNAGSQRGENMDMFMNLTNYLLQDEDFIAIRPKDFDKTTIDMTSASSQLMLAFLAFIYPTVFLGMGIFNWLRRRRA